MTRIAVALIEGISAYSQSRDHDTSKLDKEGPDEYDQRTWRERAHYDPETRICEIPGMAFKMAMADAAKRMQVRIPGKGKSTYTKNFLSGLIVPENPSLGVSVDDAFCEVVNCHSNGIRGSGSRVKRRFPMFKRGWQVEVQFMVIDDEIPQDLFMQVLKEAGNLIGVGRFRPQNGGYLGRFRVRAINWSEQAEDWDMAA